MERLPSYSEEDYSLLIKSSYSLETYTNPDQPEPMIGNAYERIGNLASIEEDLIRLAYDKHKPINKNNHESLLNLKREKDTIQDYFALNTFSPYVNLFFDIANISKEKKYSDLEFLEHLKKGMADDSFKKDIQQKRKAISKNKNSLLRYIESLFEYRSRLLVLRIDFSYEKDAGGFFTRADGEKIDLIFGAKNKDLLEKWSIEVREQRSQLIKKLKKIYQKDLIGYVWKLEYGADKAFHYHMIFFLDESKHHQDVRIAESIGEIWKDEITNGKGIYWNCNAQKKNFEKNGRIATGKIKHDDKKLRENLNIMASYLTKPDYFVKLALSNDARTFGKGGKPKKIKSGRPRE